jgi:DNA polymerase-3 subunit delta
MGHLIEGEDTYRRQQQRNEIIEANVPAQARDLAVAHFSLNRSSLGEILARARILPMLSSKQVIVITDVDAIGEAELGELEDYLAAPVDFTVLVFEAAKLDRRTRVARLLLNRCERHDAESPKDDGALERIALSMAKEVGVQLDREAVEDLVFAVGNEQGTLRAELEKLRAYVEPGRRAESSDVMAVVIAARRFSIFDLADLLAERRRADALARLRRLLEAGVDPIAAVGLLAWLYRQLLIAQAMPRNTPTGIARRTIRAPQEKVGLLLQQARRFSRRELSAGLCALQEVDVSLKSSPANPEAVLEMLIVRLTEGSGRVAGAARG